MATGRKKTIINKKGIKLAAISFIPEKYSHVLIICHGFKGAKENSGRIFSFASSVNELGIGVLAFDFTGNGESEGDFDSITLTRQVQDLYAVIDYAKEEHDLPLLLLGRSFGGSTLAASAMLDESIAACIFWSTPVLLADTFSRDMEIPGEPEALAEFEQEKVARQNLLEDLKNHNMAEYLLQLKEKAVLIIHGTADETVNLDNIDYFRRYLPKADYVIVDGADHRFEGCDHIRAEATISWLRALIQK